MLCKAKAVWLETSAASDPAPHDEKDGESLQGVSRGNGTLSAQIWTVFASSSAPTDTLQLLLHSLWSCPLCPAATGVTRQLRDGTETPSSGAQRKSSSLWVQIQQPLSLPRSGDEQRAAMSNEQRTRCPAHTRTRSGTRQPRGHQDPLNTTGNVTAEAILHPQLPDFGALAPGVHASRGQTFEIKHKADAYGMSGGCLNISMTTMTTTTTTTTLKTQNCCSTLRRSCELLNCICAKISRRLQWGERSSWLKSQTKCR